MKITYLPSAAHLSRSGEEMRIRDMNPGEEAYPCDYKSPEDAGIKWMMEEDHLYTSDIDPLHRIWKPYVRTEWRTRAEVLVDGRYWLRRVRII
jgi:hypothetical protein